MEFARNIAAVVAALAGLVAASYWLRSSQKSGQGRLYPPDSEREERVRLELLRQDLVNTAANFRRAAQWTAISIVSGVAMYLFRFL